MARRTKVRVVTAGAARDGALLTAMTTRIQANETVAATLTAPKTGGEETKTGGEETKTETVVTMSTTAITARARAGIRTGTVVVAAALVVVVIVIVMMTVIVAVVVVDPLRVRVVGVGTHD